MTTTTRKREKKAQALLTIEKSLELSLKPVNPNPEFVHRLEYRLNNYPRVSLERRSQLGLYLIIAAGLITCLSVFWALWRYFRRS
jgi:hypothetical protein